MQDTRATQTARRGARRRGGLVVLLLAGLVVATSVSHRAASTLRATLPADRDLVYLPKTSVLRALALGHTEMMADLVYLRAILLSSAKLSADQRRAYVRAHLEAVNQLAPDFRAPYLVGGRLALYSGGPITNDDVVLSSEVLERGVRRFPSDWELAFALGCNYIIELKTDDPKQRAAWRSIGAHWVRRAALDGGGPPWLPGLASSIMTEEGQAEAALRYLEEAYLTAADEPTREDIGRLLAAKRKSNLRELSASRDALVDGWRRTMPYAPPDFYVLIGPPPTARLDPAYLLRALLPPEPASSAVERPERDDVDGR